MLWMLYSLFSIEISGERFIFEGKEFLSHQECMYFSTKNIKDLNNALVFRLDDMYGENTYTILEVGCVQKDNHKNRKIIMNNNKGEPV